MTQLTGKKKLVTYSDDDDRVPDSPSPVARKPRGRRDESEDETVSSDDGFINDEAEEEDDESGSEAIKSYRLSSYWTSDSTPPARRRRPAKYQVESDEEEENIPKACHYRPDDLASPKKKTVATTDKDTRHCVVLSSVISDEEDEDKYHTSSKKSGFKADSASCRQEEHQYDEYEERSQRCNKKGAAVDENSDDEKPQCRGNKGATDDQRATNTPAKSTKHVKDEALSDSNVEFIDTPKSASKGKGNRSASTPKKATQGKSPRKKPAPKSKPTVDDSDEDVAVAALKLAPGDTMYREKRASKVQPVNLKRSLPVMPPYKTRASGLINEQSTVTPSKKQRKDTGDDTQDSLDSEEIPNDHHADKIPTVGKADRDGGGSALHVKTERSDIKKNDDNVFDAKPSSAQAKTGSSAHKPKKYPVVLNQKYTDRCWSALPRPAACEVHDPNLLDEALNAAGSYDKLVPLRYCDVQNSGQLYTGALTGTILWSAWNSVLPERDIAKLVLLLEFQNEGRFVNLSRVDPSLLAGRYMSEIRHEIMVDNQTAICITVGCARESALGPDASFGGPFITRGLCLVFISLEWERWGSTIGEIARRPVLKTQLWNFAVTFGTRLICREDGPTSSTRKADNLPALFFNTYESPKKKAVAGASSAIHLPNFVGQLEFTDEIPVYDVRDLSKDFKWSALVFENPAAYFPKFDLFNNGGEIPSNSLCAVRYVTQLYHVPADRDASNGKGKAKAKVTDDEPQDLRIAPLIQWVYVLGTL